MDQEAFDDFVSPLDYPVFVLTLAAPGGGQAGCLVGFTTQCSISPPRFLVCLSEANHTFRCSRDAKFAALHRLGAEHRDVAELFGGRTGDDLDKFARYAWTEGPGGVPLLARCAATLVGEIESRVDVGDHEALVLRPIQVRGRADGAAMMFSAVRDIRPGHDA